MEEQREPGSRLAARLAPGAPSRYRRLVPTDVAQFIRLEQCQRYLRLRLHERAEGLRAIRDYGVVPQTMPPLLTRSGLAFEERIEAALDRHCPTLRLASPARGAAGGDDNALLVERARALPPGEVLVLLQPRLDVTLNGWRLRGDIDLLRLERSDDGALHVLIADLKSSATAKVEHRLQVAFYQAMLLALFAGAAIEPASVRTAIVYRGPGEAAAARRSRLTPEIESEQRAAAACYLGTADALLEIVVDGASYLEAVHDLVTGPGSIAEAVAATPFQELPYHLSAKCDGCLYNELCMKWSAEHDDLSLLPYLGVDEKAALRREGIASMRALALLKEPPAAATPTTPATLLPAPGQEERVRRLAGNWSVGPRLDELVFRARRYRAWKGDAFPTATVIPSKGHGSLPYSDAAHNPNLVRIYLDAQHDHLHDRLYLLGALVVAGEGGLEPAHRRRAIVDMTAGPPSEPATERDLLLRFSRAVLAAVVELAAPDAGGRPRAPIHLIFFDRAAQQRLLDGLARHLPTLLAATPLYDFMTQLAAFDSPIASFLAAEVREFKNYPLVCQSLQALAAYLKFDWEAGTPYRTLFRTRLFDSAGRLDRDASSWYTRRARFSSAIPLEYAYAAWGELEEREGRDDESAPYRAATPELLQGFQARRLEAMEHIAKQFKGNKLTQKLPFELPDLFTFAEKAQTLAQALVEFVTIERHVELNAWKSARHLAPERRVLMGETLLVRYREADQTPEVAAALAEGRRRQRRREEYLAHAPAGELTKEQKAATTWEPEGLRLRLRLETAGVDAALAETLALTTLREGDSLILSPRWTTDGRLPEEERRDFTPTPRQLLYAARARLERIVPERDAAGALVAAWAEVRLQDSRGGPWSRGFVFSSPFNRPLDDDTLCTLDPDPNDWYGYWCAVVTEGLRALEEGAARGHHALYDRLAGRAASPVVWPAAAAGGQARFLAGLEALHAAGALHAFEESKRAYIGGAGAEPILLVQGPPGTGKSYATAFAIFARLQGALAAGQECRVVVACKTHAATNVLLQNIREVQMALGALALAQPAIFADHFDARLLTLPLFRLQPRAEPPPGVTALAREEEKPKGARRNADIVADARWCIVAATPGGIYQLVKKRWPGQIFGHDLCHLLVLDEASQMNLPEAMLAALPLRPDGQLIVVGDHRQMPPIVKHAWEAEPRRTFAEYRAYESLFLTLRERGPRLIQFAESFRLHSDMADFLREEIYRHDGIPYHSRRRATLPPAVHADPFTAAALAPEHPLVVVVHDEGGSQTRNEFEQALVTPLLVALAHPEQHGLDAREGLGVVVPHRAQRAALQAAVPELTLSEAGGVLLSAVDTVERFQGGERDVILVSATESDRAYLLTNGRFLLDPRRLTVALSRAKHKMILVAARSIFTLFSADEETFTNAQLWKHLLRRTCTTLLWSGQRDGHYVEVWGNCPAATPGARGSGGEG